VSSTAALHFQQFGKAEIKNLAKAAAGKENVRGLISRWTIPFVSGIERVGTDATHTVEMGMSRQNLVKRSPSSIHRDECVRRTLRLHEPDARYPGQAIALPQEAVHRRFGVVYRAFRNSGRTPAQLRVLGFAPPTGMPPAPSWLMI
jgi:hypothetical protein